MFLDEALRCMSMPNETAIMNTLTNNAIKEPISPKNAKPVEIEMDYDSEKESNPSDLDFDEQIEEIQEMNFSQIDKEKDDSESFEQNPVVKKGVVIKPLNLETVKLAATQKVNRAYSNMTEETDGIKGHSLINNAKIDEEDEDNTNLSHTSNSKILDTLLDLPKTDNKDSQIQVHEERDEQDESSEDDQPIEVRLPIEMASSKSKQNYFFI